MHRPTASVVSTTLISLQKFLAERQVDISLRWQQNPAILTVCIHVTEPSYFNMNKREYWNIRPIQELLLLEYALVSLTVAWLNRHGKGGSNMNLEP
jgi:hypothetical protein